MMALERIPDQIGYLVLTEDGATICSGGELENSEHVANVAYEMITLTDSIWTDHDGYKKISVVYPDFSYTICLSNKKIYVVKKRFSAPKAPALLVDAASLNSNINNLPVTSNVVNT